MKESIYFTFIICLFCFVCDANTNEKDWINPLDMITDYYKPVGSGQENADNIENVKESENEIEEKFVSDGQEQTTFCKEAAKRCENIQINDEKIQKNGVEIQKNEEIIEPKPINEVVMAHYFKKFINILSQKFCYPNVRNHYQMEIEFSAAQCNYLIDSTLSHPMPMTSIHEIGSILDGMTKIYKLVDNPLVEPSLLRRINTVINKYYSVIVAICLVMIVSITMLLWVPTRMSVLKFLCNVFFIAFLCSLPFEWMNQFKKREAMKMATLASLPSDPCGQKLSFYDKFLSYLYLREDQCIKHTEAVYIDTVFEINPLGVMSGTLVRFFLEPIGYVGTAVKTLFTTSIAGLPVQLQASIFIFLCAIMFLLIFLACGYRIRSLIFSIEPGDRVPQVNDLTQKNIELKNKIKELKGLLKDRKQNPAIRSRRNIGDAPPPMVENEVPLLLDPSPGDGEEVTGGGGDRD